MKLSGRDAPAYFAKPDPAKTGLLIYGADAMRVALRRQQVIAALMGPEGEAEMRLTRLSGATLRKEPAELSDALRATGFFPGPRVVFLEDAADAQTAVIEAAISTWKSGDAHLVVTAGQLAARSSLRKLFEADGRLMAAGIYDDPPSRAEIEAAMKAAGLNAPPSAAMGDLEALARALDPGDFAQTVERIALYKLNDPEPLNSEEIALLAPASVEAGIDDVIHVVAEARAAAIGPIVQRLRAQGVQPVALCIAAARHFRTLHAAACDPGGPSQGIARVRPPVFGPRRDRMMRQAQRWGPAKLEQALRLLLETDLTLRSAQTAPEMAILERAFIRIAMMGGA